MKAWIVSEDGNDLSNIVFAEKASKAKSLAFGCDPLDGTEFIDLEAKRAKEFEDLEHTHIYEVSDGN